MYVNTVCLIHCDYLCRFAPQSCHNNMAVMWQDWRHCRIT